MNGPMAQMGVEDRARIIAQQQQIRQRQMQMQANNVGGNGQQPPPGMRKPQRQIQVKDLAQFQMTPERRLYWEERISSLVLALSNPSAPPDHLKRLDEDLWKVTYQIIKDSSPNPSTVRPQQTGPPLNQEVARQVQQRQMQLHEDLLRRQQQQQQQQASRMANVEGVPQIPPHTVDGGQPQRPNAVSFSEPVRQLVQQFEVVANPAQDNDSDQAAIQVLRVKFAKALEYHERAYRTLQEANRLRTHREVANKPMTEQETRSLNETIARHAAARRQSSEQIETFVRQQIAWRRAAGRPMITPELLHRLKVFMHAPVPPTNGHQAPQAPTAEEDGGLKPEISDGEAGSINGMPPFDGVGSMAGSPANHSRQLAHSSQSPDSQVKIDQESSIAGGPQQQRPPSRSLQQAPPSAPAPIAPPSAHAADNQPALTLKQGLERADSFRQITSANEAQPVDSSAGNAKNPNLQLVFKDNGDMSQRRTNFSTPIDPGKLTSLTSSATSMPAPRPTLTGSISGGPQGTMGQPAIPKLPGFLLDGGPNDQIISLDELQKLIREVMGDEMEVDEDVQQVILTYVDQFCDDIIAHSCELAKVSGAQELDVRHLVTVLDREHNIRLPGFSSDEFRIARRAQPAAGWHQKIAAVNAAKITNASSVATNGVSGAANRTTNGHSQP